MTIHKFLFLLLFICLGNDSICQNIYPYKDIKLEKPSDYTETEPLALSAATFLLSTPFVEIDANRADALLFLSNWMAGTKKYSFYMQGLVQDISTDKNLMSLFFAAMAKYSLQNKAESINPLRVDENAAKLVLAYCNDPLNNFKLKKKFRKLLEEKQLIKN